MADKTVWLIEASDPRAPGCVLPDHFLGVKGWYNGYAGDGVFDFVTRADDALRFARQKDAAMFAGAVLTLMQNRQFKDIPDGLRPNDPALIVVEHSWSD